MTKPIYSSLGSNYTLRFAGQALAGLWRPDAADEAKRQQLIDVIAQENDAEVFLFYKGRDAIEFALRVLGRGAVLTQAFACHAVEEAIVRSGCTPVYVDVAVGTNGQPGLNLSVTTLTAAWSALPEGTEVRAVLVQHMLGVPADIAKIRKWCTQHHCVLIEDLAQAAGGVTAEGEALGSFGDIVIYSFGRDKVIDGVVGGAAALRRPPVSQLTTVHLAEAYHLYSQLSDRLPLGTIAKDLTYPLLTWCIRHTLTFGVGKLLFQVAKKTGWLTSPVAAPVTHMVKLPAVYTPVILAQWSAISSHRQHRQRIAQIYQTAFGQSSGRFSAHAEGALSLLPAAALQGGSLQRFPLWVAEPDKLARTLQKQQLFLTDRWYRRAVDSGSLGLRTVYVPGSCPHAEALAQHILNLPTHRGVSPADARRLVAALLVATQSAPKESHG